MYSYRGFIGIEKHQYRFTFSNFIFLVFVDDHQIGWETVRTIINEGWIHVFDVYKNELFLKVDRADYFNIGEFAYHISGFVEVKNDQENLNAAHTFDFHAIQFYHPVIDLIFRRDRTCVERAIFALNKFKTEQLSLKEPVPRESYEIEILGNSFLLEFNMISRFNYDNPFPFLINNVIDITSKDNLNLNNVWNIVAIIKLFLQFVAQCEIINLNKIALDFIIDKSQPPSALLYLRPEETEKFVRGRIFEYSNIKDGIPNIIKLISSNSICFRSLFKQNLEYTEIHDIMNICAAFESQFNIANPKFNIANPKFNIANPKFKDKEQDAVKTKMVSELLEVKYKYSPLEQEYFDDVVKAIENYSDTLKKRIEISFDEFIRIYGEENVEFDFDVECSSFSKRMKDTRNALDHGNHKYILQTAMFHDSNLLRAITYMLILQTANVEDQNIKECLKKMSMWVLE